MDKTEKSRQRKIDLFPRSYIAPISVELPNYDFYHSPFETSIPDSRFIGRKKLREKFKELLQKNKTKSGAYLITGFRGMGKTSFVKRVLRDVIYDDDYRSDISPTSLIKQTGTMFFLWTSIIVTLSILDGLNQFTQVWFLPCILFAAVGFIWSSICIYDEYNKSGYHPNLQVVPEKEFSNKSKRLGWKLFKRFIIDTINGTYKFRKRVSSSIAAVITVCLSMIVFVLVRISDKFAIGGNAQKGISWGIIDLALLFIYIVITGFVVMWLFRIVYKFIHKVVATNGNNWLNDFLNVLLPSGKKPDFIEISLGFDSVTERDVYVSIISQLRKKLNAWSTKYKFSNWRIFVLIVTLFVVYNTPLIDTFRDQVRKSNLTRDIFPALYDPLDSLKVKSKESFSNYHNRIKEAYIKDKAEGLRKELDSISNGSNRVVVQDLNASSAEIAIDNRKQGFLTIVIGSVARINANINIGLGIPLSYHINRVSLLIFGKQSYGYYFFIWFTQAWFLLYNLAYWFYSSFVFKFSKIYSKIKELHFRAFAGYTSAFGGESEGRFKLSLQSFLGRSTSVQYNMATAKELESELLLVLKLINEKAQRGLMPHYIIIMDEVDKVDPHGNYTVSELAAETKANGKSNEDNVADSSRRRQQAVFHLLSNLKHFFSTADTQFVFIAGQELFDASLADVSDRNYFLGSVFNQVLNIESFYSDLSDRQNSNITSMIESYLCKSLLPDWYIREKSQKKDFKTEKARLSEYPTLSDYREYVEEYLLPPVMYSVNYDKVVIQILDSYERKADVKGKYKQVVDCIKNGQHQIDISIFDRQNVPQHSELNAADKALEETIVNSKDYAMYEQRKAKITKLISQLYAFTVYLAYRSNGAPKKISALLDENVYPYDAIYNTSASDCSKAHLILGHGKNNLYLHLGFNFQYNINLITYLVSPVLFSLNTSLRDYGDKLLIGASFIFDHIMKFHKTGFSQSDLDLMPEFIDINRAPEMRSLISRIIDNLKENYLDEVHSGLYDYTFNRKLVEEINYLSKINDKESAAFNFTLDESLRMKQYLYSKISQLKKPNSSVLSTSSETTYFPDSGIYTHHYIESQLGDLHFYDNEFIDAIIQYKNSITNIRQKEVKSMDFSQFINYVKTMLKIGLTFEKLGNNDKALAYYEETTYAVIQYRDIDLSKFGLHEVYIERPRDAHTWENVLENFDNELWWHERRNAILDDWETRFREMFRPGLWLNEKIREKTIYKLEKLKPGERINFIVQLADNTKSNSFYVESLYEIPELSGGSIVVDRSVNFWNFLMNTEFSVLKEKYLGRSSMFENLQLFYLPLIAKLQVVERAYLGGVVLSDVLRVLKEYRFISKILRRNEEVFIQTEFFRKLANVLFFKNSSLSIGQITKTPDNEYEYKIKKQNLDHLFNLLDLNSNSVSCSTQYPCGGSTSKQVSCSADACLFYTNNLYQVIENEMWTLNRQVSEPKLWKASGISRLSCIELIFEELTNGLVRFFTLFNPVLWDNIALNISYLGDAICTCPLRESHASRYLSYLAKILQDNPRSEELDANIIQSLLNYKFYNAHNQIDLIIKAYVLSALIYKRTGNYRGESFAYKKILYLIQWSGIAINTSIKDFCTKFLFSRSIDCLLLSQGSIHRMEIQKIKKRMMDEAYINPDLIDLRLTTINADAQEYVLAYENFNLWQAYRIIKHMKEEKIPIKTTLIIGQLKEIIDKHSINLRKYFQTSLNYASIHLTHNLILSHINNSLLNRIVYTILELLPSWEDIQALISEPSPKLLQVEYHEEDNDDVYMITSLKARAILDGLFSIHNAIKHVNVNGITYKTNYSFLGSLYYYMYHWCNDFHHIMLQIRGGRESNTEYGVTEIDGRKLRLDSSPLDADRRRTRLRGNPSQTKNRINELGSVVSDQGDRIINIVNSDFSPDNRMKNLELEIDASLTALFSGEYNHLISSLYYVTKALEHYQMAIDTHSGGDHYRQLISGMHFLQEDFSSDTYHFFAALDRFILNSDKFRNRIEKLKKANSKTIINKYSYYSD